MLTLLEDDEEEVRMAAAAAAGGAIDALTGSACTGSQTELVQRLAFQLLGRHCRRSPAFRGHLFGWICRLQGPPLSSRLGQLRAGAPRRLFDRDELAAAAAAVAAEEPHAAWLGRSAPAWAAHVGARLQQAADWLLRAPLQPLLGNLLAQVLGSWEAQLGQPLGHPDADALETLRQFDLTGRYGPCTGLTRLERWERAAKLGLHPPEEVKAILVRQAPDSLQLEGIWTGRV
ncbi:hypothetical protein WJX81_004398 [Elliptochloris bilobata]|uniref:DNA polymerase delta subunit 4 n=1 Tax=Elliptochloris bilobata TaxID=381761 RepID=A0AAW1S7K3_9CHLO